MWANVKPHLTSVSTFGMKRKNALRCITSNCSINPRWLSAISRNVHSRFLGFKLACQKKNMYIHHATSQNLLCIFRAVVKDSKWFQEWAWEEWIAFLKTNPRPLCVTVYCFHILPNIAVQCLLHEINIQRCISEPKKRKTKRDHSLLSQSFVKIKSMQYNKTLIGFEDVCQPPHPSNMCRHGAKQNWVGDSSFGGEKSP